MSDEVYDLGMRTRRKLLGDEYVDNALQSANELNQPFQDLATEYCFGRVWARDGLDWKTRSLINVGMLIALGRDHELEVHMGVALRNGCTLEEMREVLLQATIYCGMPAGSVGFRLARKVFEQHAVQAAAPKKAG